MKKSIYGILALIAVIAVVEVLAMGIAKPRRATVERHATAAVRQHMSRMLGLRPSDKMRDHLRKHINDEFALNLKCSDRGFGTVSYFVTTTIGDWPCRMGLDYKWSGLKYIPRMTPMTLSQPSEDSD